MEQDATRRWRGCNKLLSERRQKRSPKREVFMQKEGTLHILWMNSAAHNEVPSYHVEFAVGKRSVRAEFPLIAATQIYRRASVIVTAS